MNELTTHKHNLATDLVGCIPCVDVESIRRSRVLEVVNESGNDGWKDLKVRQPDLEDQPLVHSFIHSVSQSVREFI